MHFILARTALISVIATVAALLVVGPICLYFQVPRLEFALVVTAFTTLVVTPTLAFWYIRQEVKTRQLLMELAKINAELISVGAEFRAIARRDGLTGLLNRLAFFEAAEQLCREHGGSLIMIDADHFKSINDTHGHGAGDAALIAIADVIKVHCDAVAIKGRLGGEEFAVFLPRTGPDDVKMTAERIRKSVAQTEHTGAEASFQLTVSLGVAAAHGPSELTTLYRIADQALYRAKREGRNCIRIEAAPRAAA